MGKRLPRTPYVCGSLLVGLWLAAVPGWAGWEEGWRAYDSGDYATALREWLPLAQQGHAVAQLALGVMYGEGQGVPQDYAHAVQWYRRAAEQGLAAAQNNLGRMYDLGQGVPQDDSQAMQWYRRAAEQGVDAAQYNLGLMSLAGRGIPQDYVQATQWFRRAAEQGHALAQYSLGFMYHTGQGVPQDYAHAVQWYRRAAEQGSATAQNNLGAMYEHGRGVPQDSIQAHLWYNLAAAGFPSDADREKAVRNRNAIAARMTPAQLARAQALARTWQAKPEDEIRLQRPGGLLDDAPTRIRRAQERLTALGFAPGPVDGVLGPRMRTALQQFQRRQGLPVTGELDAATERALGGR